MVKRRQTTIYKTTHYKDRATRTPLKTRVNSGALEGSAVHAPLVTPVVLLLKQLNDKNVF
jgi:hypothetical protein